MSNPSTLAAGGSHGAHANVPSVVIMQHVVTLSDETRLSAVGE
ncbi:hypothetical protein BN2537_2969 [Streptomyces venezuelae]|nr:hypothetical protein BN2537_2969 [Streptomyces venezuelae]